MEGEKLGTIPGNEISTSVALSFRIFQVNS